MEKESQDTRQSFICFKCKEKNYYDTNDYLKNSNELLMEWKTIGSKTKEVIIICRICSCKNKVNIIYY